MTRALFILLGLTLATTVACGCGLDWTLPANHFDGVEEHGYVSYWEKIGEADLGDGLVIPVNVNFNSHREASSPTLGKGWMVALLESHVEPLNENSMKVVMPDGWNFIFLRNGGTETWRGNAGWVGETRDALFTITAPCGWKIKFDGGKIQEIDSDKNRTLTYKYNGGVATEVDVDSKAFVQVESNASTGVATDLLIGSQKIEIAQAQRPQVMTKLNQNLVTGFDPSLSQLQWPDGRKESFTFGTDKGLNPTLAIACVNQTQRNFTWDATTRQIKTDGEWIYHLVPGDNIALERSNAQGQYEAYKNDGATGLTIEKALDGVETRTYRLVNAGVLSGKIRKIIKVQNGYSLTTYTATYNEKGALAREILGTATILHDDRGDITEVIKNGKIDWQASYDASGKLIAADFTHTVSKP